MFYFIELKDRKRNKDARKEAKTQLLVTVRSLIKVPEILEFVNKFQAKCCYFSNKQSKAPANINATIAFGRMGILSGPLEMEYPALNEYGFKYYEAQVLIL